MKKKNIELDYKEVLDTKFIERIGSPLNYPMYCPDSKQIVQPIKNKKILVIRLESCAELYALNNSVTYITDNKEKYDKFLNKVNDEKFGSDDSAILFDDWKNIDKLLEENNMKFDVCIMNPPWGRIGWEIANIVWLHSLKIVCINGNQILHTLNRFQNNSYFVKLQTMFDSIETEELIDAGKVFVADLYKDFVQNQSNCAIVTITKQTIAKYSHASRIEQMILQWLLNNPAKLKYNFVDDYGVYISIISGCAGDFHCLAKHMIICKKYNDKMICCKDKYIGYMSKANKIAIESGKNIGKIWWDCYCKNKNTKRQNSLVSGLQFNTLIEADNFVNSQTTKFIKYVNSLLLTDVHIGEKNLFVMQDYSQPWTDKRFCEFFKITGYIDDNTAEPGSEWAMILDYVKNN